MTQIQENSKKTHFGPDLGLLDQNSGLQFFSKDLASSVTLYHGQLSSCIISAKTNDLILKKFRDGWMGRQTDSDFMGRRPTNVKRTYQQIMRTYQQYQQIVDSGTRL